MPSPEMNQLVMVIHLFLGHWVPLSNEHLASFKWWKLNFNYHAGKRL